MVEKQVLTTLVQYSTENEIKKKDGREKLKSFFPPACSQIFKFYLNNEICLATFLLLTQPCFSFNVGLQLRGVTALRDFLLI